MMMKIPKESGRISHGLRSGSRYGFCTFLFYFCFLQVQNYFTVKKSDDEPASNVEQVRPPPHA